MPEMTSAYDYALLRKHVEEQNDRFPLYDEEELEHYMLGDSQELFPTRDFVKEFMKDAFPMRRVNVNVSGGNDKMRYFTNVGYLFQEGVFKTEKFDEYDYDHTLKDNRVNFRYNFDINVNYSLKMFINIQQRSEKSS